MKSSQLSPYSIILLTIFFLSFLSSGSARHVRRNRSLQDDLLRRELLYDMLQERSVFNAAISRRALSRTNSASSRTSLNVNKALPAIPKENTPAKKPINFSRLMTHSAPTQQEHAVEHEQPQTHPAEEPRRGPPSLPPVSLPSGQSHAIEHAPEQASEHASQSAAQPAPHQEQPASPVKAPEKKTFVSLAPKPNLDKPLPLVPTYENAKDHKNLLEKTKLFVSDRPKYTAWKAAQNRVDEAHQLELQNTGKNKVANSYLQDQVQNMAPTLKADNDINDHRAKDRADKWWAADKIVSYTSALAGKKLTSPFRRRAVWDEDEDFVFLEVRDYDFEDMLDELFL